MLEVGLGCQSRSDKPYPFVFFANLLLQEQEVRVLENDNSCAAALPCWRVWSVRFGRCEVVTVAVAQPQRRRFVCQISLCFDWCEVLMSALGVVAALARPFPSHHSPNNNHGLPSAQ